MFVSPESIANVFKHIQNARPQRCIFHRHHTRHAVSHATQLLPSLAAIAGRLQGRQKRTFFLQTCMSHTWWRSVYRAAHFSIWNKTDAFKQSKVQWCHTTPKIISRRSRNKAAYMCSTAAEFIEPDSLLPTFRHKTHILPVLQRTGQFDTYRLMLIFYVIIHNIRVIQTSKTVIFAVYFPFYLFRLFSLSFLARVYVRARYC